LDAASRKLEIPRTNASVAVESANVSRSKARTHSLPMPANRAEEKAGAAATAMISSEEQRAEKRAAAVAAAALSMVEKGRRAEVNAAANAAAAGAEKRIVDGKEAKARSKEQEKKEREEDLRKMQQDPFYVPESIFGPTRELMLNVSSIARKRCCYA
jgi:hypothetical protein